MKFVFRRQYCFSNSISSNALSISKKCDDSKMNSETPRTVYKLSVSVNKINWQG